MKPQPWERRRGANPVAVARLLLQRGARFNLRRPGGQANKTALEVVRDGGHTEMNALFDTYIRWFHTIIIKLDVVGKYSHANHPSSARHGINADLTRYIADFLIDAR